jgi:uncharacterized surface protein with fasciclin (FAS1) repeats
MAFVSCLAPAVASAASSSAAAVCGRHTSLRGVPVQCAACAPARSAPARPATSMVLGKTFTESLAMAGNFTQLLKLAKASGLDLDARRGTLFAPDDRAFGRLKPGTLEAWYAKPTVAKAILDHHLLPDKVLTLAKIKGCGWWETTMGGPLSYEGLGAVIKVGGSLVIQESSNRECLTGNYHVIESIMTPMGVTKAGINAGYIPSIPIFTESTVATLYPVKPQRSLRTYEAAALPGSVGGRKAMGLIKQLPFWMYGPPFNAAIQEDYEPISIAAPVGAKVDYQLMPPGTVVVEPDSCDANKLNPISGMSKYIGNTKKQVGGKAESNYSRLDQCSNTW